MAKSAVERYRELDHGGRRNLIMSYGTELRGLLTKLGASYARMGDEASFQAETKAEVQAIRKELSPDLSHRRSDADLMPTAATRVRDRRKSDRQDTWRAFQGAMKQAGAHVLALRRDVTRASLPPIPKTEDTSLFSASLQAPMFEQLRETRLTNAYLRVASMSVDERLEAAKSTPAISELAVVLDEFLMRDLQPMTHADMQAHLGRELTHDEKQALNERIGAAQRVYMQNLTVAKGHRLSADEKLAAKAAFEAQHKARRAAYDAVIANRIDPEDRQSFDDAETEIRAIANEAKPVAMLAIAEGPTPIAAIA